MPPRPLKNLDVGRPYSSTFNYQPLTPRTPHSRAGRAEEALDVEDEDPDDAGHRPHAEQQAEPLLASSASAAFPDQGFPDSVREVDERQAKGGVDERKLGLIVSRAPLLLGVTAAFFLLFLVAVSFKKPEALLSAIGVSNSTKADAATNATAPAPSPLATTEPAHDAMHTLSYANYTSFPLLPSEYLQECVNIHLSMKGSPMGSYWFIPPGGTMDVEHHDKLPTTHLPEHGFTKVCTSTITYMLDGYVGLAADLALMAQAAGLAREVRGP